MVDSRMYATLRRDGRVAEGARLESVFRGNSNVGSNPTLSAISKSNRTNRLIEALGDVLILCYFG